MSPNELTSLVRTAPPLLKKTTTVEEALDLLLESGLPALPVVDDKDHAIGIFGEREFMTAIFPGYVNTLTYAGFVSSKLEDVLEKRANCMANPVSLYMNTEHTAVDDDAADLQVAEVFLHHRVLIVPVEHDRRVVGVVTRSAFFEALARRMLSGNTA